MSFELVDTADAILVKTPNYDSTPISEEEAVTRLPATSPILTALESPHVDAYFGEKNGEVTVRQWSYSKEKYDKPAVEQIMREKLFKCIRCNRLSSNRVGEKNMAYVNYMQVGKDVLIAGIGGTVAGAVHVMFLMPQFAGQQIIPGVPTTSVVDMVIGFLVGVGTRMYAKGTTGQLIGYGVAGFLFALGILQIVLPAFTLGGVRLSAPATVITGPPGVVPSRASYMAPAGVVLNKHGSVPQFAPGTFG